MGSCLQPNVSNKEFKFNFDKQITAKAPEFKTRDVDRGAMLSLAALPNKAPQLARTYKKDSVRVTVY